MLKILIVDDEDDIREILENAFEMSGHNDFEFASSGKEAIEKIKVTNYDLVVCDNNMPNGTGGTVYTYIADHSICVKFVLCSSDRPEDIDLFQNRNDLFFFIEKPDIISGVEKCLSKLARC